MIPLPAASSILKAAPYIVIAFLLIAAYALYERGNYAQAQLKTVTESVRINGENAAKRSKEIQNGWIRQVQGAEARGNAADARLAKWMRKSNSASSILPPSTGTPKGTDRTGQVCFDEATLDGALRQFRDGVRELIGQGQAGINAAQTLLDSWPR